MAIETASFISQLVSSNPAGTDLVSDADNHIRLIKQVLKNTFPNLAGSIPFSVSQMLGVVPFGGIIPFYGQPAGIPAGWALCNGQTVNKSDGTGTVTTPDLRDCYVVGVSASKTLKANLGAESQTLSTNPGGFHTPSGTIAKGGKHDHGGNTGNTVLSESQIPPHRHTVQNVAKVINSGGNNNGLYFPSSQKVDTVDIDTTLTGGGSSHNHSIGDDGEHIHSLTMNSVSNHQHDVIIPMFPKSVALNYIMKV